MKTNIKQFDSKQMWTVDYDKVYSYNTLVGVYDNEFNEWVFTEYKYSLTTSKQITQYINRNGGKRNSARFERVADAMDAPRTMQLCTPRQWY